MLNIADPDTFGALLRRRFDLPSTTSGARTRTDGRGGSRAASPVHGLASGDTGAADSAGASVRRALNPVSVDMFLAEHVS